MISGKKDEFLLLPDDVCQYAKSVLFRAKEQARHVFHSRERKPPALAGGQIAEKEIPRNQPLRRDRTFCGWVFA